MRSLLPMQLIVAAIVTVLLLFVSLVTVSGQKKFRIITEQEGDAPGRRAFPISVNIDSLDLNSLSGDSLFLMAWASGRPSPQKGNNFSCFPKYAMYFNGFKNTPAKQPYVYNSFDDELPAYELSVPTKDPFWEVRLINFACTETNIDASANSDIELSKIVCDGVGIYADTSKIGIIDCKIGYLDMMCGDGNLSFSKSSIKFWRLGDRINLDYIDSTIIPDTVSLEANFKGELDLMKFSHPLKHSKLLIDLQNIDLSYVNLDYQYFDYLPDKRTDKDNSKMSDCFTQLLQIQKKYGYDAGYEKLDKELRQFKYYHDGLFGHVLNFIDKNWWGYGYDKYLIFRNSLVLLLIVLSINLIFYKRLIYDTYTIAEVKIADQKMKKQQIKSRWTKALRKFAYCTLYTSYIFWGWKLDFDRLKLTSIGLAAWIIIQYLIGIICLAYLAGYVISK